MNNGYRNCNTYNHNSERPFLLLLTLKCMASCVNIN
ncbi:hypothetical protein Phi18:3_gp033 [Cellulophaga phage phi18:3]|uniref:Uncharacterized protein n=1 Tax=Cellulophaga phage phi18:3 TaxID=1327983 RepID=S0A191_9CAUD|nr:hypothetical protein Phi18:3_gp033 [Cellulophaga phage phi18:3]AGO48545.1 hypothetical protein Phi18:3_gp033 [Cellulophaga phage phi18:3]